MTHDRADDVTRVALSPYGDVNTFAIGATYECLGTAPCRPGALQMLLVADAKHPAYATLDTVVLVVREGERLKFSPTYSAQSGRGGVREALSWMMSEDEFRALTGGPMADIRLGSFHARFTPAQLDALRSLMTRMAPLDPE